MVLNFYNNQLPGEIKFDIFSAKKVQTVIIHVAQFILTVPVCRIQIEFIIES